MPNVNPLLEMMDLREAQRSFEANLNALTLARSMFSARWTCCVEPGADKLRCLKGASVTDALRLNPAIAAYTQALQRPPADDAAATPTFGALLEQTLSQAIDAGHKGEAIATAAVSNQTSLQEVVEAVNAAELTLQTVVAVRDRMIAAYQEILRMPI